MIELDGTPNKSQAGRQRDSGRIDGRGPRGGRVPARRRCIAIWAASSACLLPVPQMNILNGGAHADNSVDPQEFMIVPYGAEKFSEALRWGAEVFHTLKGVLKKRGYSTAVGDEGGFAPNLKSNEEALEVILEAITKAGYTPGEQIGIALDPAASEFYDADKKKYIFKKSDKSERTSDQMVEFWADWVRQYPIVSLEDGMAEDDWDGWKLLHRRARKEDPTGRRRHLRHQHRTSAQGHRARHRQLDSDQGEPDRHADRDAGGDADGRRRGYTSVISHRSGETEDPFIADFAVATSAGQIKTGSASRTDRIAKYNQLLRIEEELGGGAKFAGRGAVRNEYASRHDERPARWSSPSSTVGAIRPPKKATRSPPRASPLTTSAARFSEHPDQYLRARPSDCRKGKWATAKSAI